MPLPLLALGLGSAGSSLLGSLLDSAPTIDWGTLGSQYLNQLGDAYRGQFMRNYAALSPLTMGQENAPGYADAALAAFQRSQAYQGLLSNLASQANNNALAARGNAGAYGQNFGVGQAAYGLSNPGAAMNQYIANALAQQYLQGQQQFGQLAGLRLGGASDISQGAAGLTHQAMGLYQQQPSALQRLGQGLQGLGRAGFQYMSLRGLGTGFNSGMGGAGAGTGFGLGTGGGSGIWGSYGTPLFNQHVRPGPQP